MKKLIPATAVAVAALFAATGAFAQTTSPTSPTTPPAKIETTPMAPSAQPTPAQHAPMMTEAEAKELIDAKVISSDKKNVGEVAAIQRDSSGNVTELHADVGGFLGMGETRVRLMPSQFTVVNKQINTTLTAEQVSALPKIEKK
ncbi:MAG: PRC-barrel domain-containing protein [Hyphomicrobiaceae bacterium]